ncbi:MAG: hypothetical protein Q4C98_03210 [Capnocytophaga sp.]|nr:hypothetical protein [Capnocytophaga sp.]
MFGKFFGKSEKNKSEENNDFQGGWNDEEGVYYAKGSFDDEIEYNNELICIINVTDDNMTDMNEAMDEKDYTRAEQIRLAWIAETPQYIAQVNQLGDYEGDSQLKEAAVTYFKEFEKLMQKGYKKLIQLRLEGKKGSAEEQNQLNDNNDFINQITDDFNQASDEFLAKYSDENDYDAQSDYGNFYNPYMNMQHDPNNPMLASIHGISLADYAAAAANAANGMTETEICNRLGIDLPVWDEVNQLWVKRMQQDTSFAVMSLYGQYFGQASSHPKFSKQAVSASSDNDYLNKIATDEKFYYELCGARQAAYEVGLDGAQWIEDNYGISLGDFQSVAMKWMTAGGNVVQMLAYQEKKQKEYAQKFANEMGGGIADDIDF